MTQREYWSNLFASISGHVENDIKTKGKKIKVKECKLFLGYVISVSFSVCKPIVVMFLAELYRYFLTHNLSSFSSIDEDNLRRPVPDHHLGGCSPHDLEDSRQGGPWPQEDRQGGRLR